MQTSYDSQRLNTATVSKIRRDTAVEPVHKSQPGHDWRCGRHI